MQQKEDEEMARQLATEEAAAEAVRRQQQLAELSQAKEQVKHTEEICGLLKQAGLLKQDHEGTMTTVLNWEEHQQILQQRQQEEAHAQQLQQ